MAADIEMKEAPKPSIDSKEKEKKDDVEEVSKEEKEKLILEGKTSGIPLSQTLPLLFKVFYKRSDSKANFKIISF